MATATLLVPAEEKKESIRGHAFSSITPQELENSSAQLDLFKLWLKDPNRVDLGECLFAGVVELIPAWIHPNMITCTGLVFMIMLLGAAMAVPPVASFDTKAVLCVACAMLDLLAMAMDSLDGLHARATRQTSSVGALLDHWFDSLSAPILAGALGISLDADALVLEIALMSTTLLFNLQLIVYYYKRQFPRVAGVEAQLLVMAGFVLSALMYSAEIVVFHSTLAYSLAIVEVAFFVYYLQYFTAMFDSAEMWWTLFVNALSLLFQSFLHFQGYLCTAEFIIFQIITSARINGDLVLCTEARERYVSAHWSFFGGYLLILAENLFFRDVVLWLLTVLIPTEYNLAQSLHPTSWIVMAAILTRSLSLFFTMATKAHQFDVAKKQRTD